MNILPKELTAAKRAADRAARKWPGVDADEIDATLRLWLVENYRWVETYRTADGGAAKLNTALNRAAHRACANEHRAVHHQAEGEHYTLTQLKRLLPFLWERETWAQTTTPDLDGMPHAPSTGESDTALTMLLDVDAAFEALPSEARNLLAWRYHDDLTYAAIGKRIGATEDAARMAVRRALERLHRSLGGDGRYN